MKVLVTGSRRWTDVKAIDDAIAQAGATLIIHGAAAGADLIAERIAKERQINYRGYPAKWKRLGKSAGPVRNTEMLHAEHLMPGVAPIDLVLAFPMKESVGTLDMMDQCQHAGIKVVVDTRYL